MGCTEFSLQLATFRELSPAERERLQAHLAACPACAATLAAYQEQDRALSALSNLRLSSRLSAEVLARTVGRHRVRHSPAWRWATGVVVSLFVFLVAMGGTISAASGALPGDVLYPVKRAAEEVRLTFTLSETARAHYEELLAKTRHQETEEVLKQGREAEVELQGKLEAAPDGGWVVDGVSVVMAPDAFGPAQPQPGAVVKVEAYASAGQLTVRRVNVVPPKPVKPVGPVAQASATAMPQPSATEAQVIAQPTAVPTSEPTQAPTAEPSATRTPRRTAPPTRTASPVVPSATPAEVKPTLASTATPIGGGPIPRRTRILWPTARPTAKPTAAEPTPLPTRTRLPWPTAKPTATPGENQPTQMPTRTPRTPWRTPKPSTTPHSEEPTRVPSRTPKISWPTPRPSPTRNKPDATPTATPHDEQPTPTWTPQPPKPTRTPPVPTPTSAPPTSVPPTSTPGPQPTSTCPCG